MSIENYWLYIEPFVYISVKRNNRALLYNSYNGKVLINAHTSIESLSDLSAFNEEDRRYECNTIQYISKWLKSLIMAVRKNGLSVLRHLDIYSPIYFKIAQSKAFLNEKSILIRVSDGCLGNCSYCGIKKARGTLKSKSLDEILNEFKMAVNKGHKGFVLVSEDLFSYGKDIGEDISTLLNQIILLDGKWNLDLKYSHPNSFLEFFPKVEDVFTSGKIKQIIVAIQSGGSKILNLMNRPCNFENYKTTMQRLKTISPSILLGTNIIVGFPGETEEDFMETLNLINEIPFDYVMVYIYSDLPGTRSCKMGSKVPQDVIYKRYRLLIKTALIKHLKR